MLFMPDRSTAETCTKTSVPPWSGWMKPKPLVPLNHFTVPVAMTIPFNQSLYLPGRTECRQDSNIDFERGSSSGGARRRNNRKSASKFDPPYMGLGARE